MGSRFSGRHVLVTGGAQSIGFEIARQFCREGAMVTIFDYSKEALEEATGQLRSQGYEVNPFPVDVSLQQQVIEAVNEAERIAPIDVLVNNAGICLVAPFLNIEAADWHRTLDVKPQWSILRCPECV
jgi:NAD(P)-dependent dehydrogenase (short-subunit alcohol dehydrogenase family)